LKLCFFGVKFARAVFVYLFFNITRTRFLKMPKVKAEKKSRVHNEVAKQGRRLIKLKNHPKTIIYVLNFRSCLQ
jgi:hypothetical protein